MTNHLSTNLDFMQHLINNSNGGVMRWWFRHRRVYLKIHHSVFFSPRRPTTKLWNTEYDIQIHLCVLELSQHSHREILLHAVPLWTNRFGNSHSCTLLWNQEWDCLFSRPFSLPGYLYENSTGDMQFTFAGLNPYTRYTLEVRAKAAGEVGPSVQTELITPAEGDDNTRTPTHL